MDSRPPRTNFLFVFTGTLVGMLLLAPIQDRLVPSLSDLPFSRIFILSQIPIYAIWLLTAKGGRRDLLRRGSRIVPAAIGSSLLVEWALLNVVSTPNHLTIVLVLMIGLLVTRLARPEVFLSNDHDNPGMWILGPLLLGSTLLFRPDDLEAWPWTWRVLAVLVAVVGSATVGLLAVDIRRWQRSRRAAQQTGGRLT